MKNTLKIIGAIIAIVLVIDALGFTAWALSGQHPVDGFYIGTITTHTLQAIIK